MRLLPTILAILALATPLAAQVAVPATGTQIQVPDIRGTVGGVTGTLDQTLEGVDETVHRQARQLLRARERTLDRLLRRNRDTIERDANGDLARRGELLAIGVRASDRATIDNAGFRILSTEQIEGLDLTVTRLGIPQDLELADAERLARQLGIGTEVSADNLHFQAGTAAGSIAPSVVAAQVVPNVNLAVGMLDSAPGRALSTVPMRGFAKGALTPSDHGSAILSLLRDAGIRNVRVADVYGTDPAGGNALAIAKGLGWLVTSGSKVVTISLVGPRNALVERAVASAQGKGVVVVAAVGNDGPAAPPAYPASYSGVVAVTGVDKRNRALIEAGRALHLDYAAPGADVYAYDARGKRKRWRGTSFATPLAAARIAAAMQRGDSWRSRVDGEARDLGRKGPDSIFGRGLLCGSCARRK